jgi:hypothetical protein
MTFGRASVFALIAAVLIPYAPAAEQPVSKESLGDVMVSATVERFRVHIDYCSVAVPELKKDLSALMEKLTTRVHRIGDGLLASDSFKTMKNQTAPTDLIVALKESNEEEMQEYRKLDPAQSCRSALKGYGSMTDSEIEANMAQGLTSIQNAMKAFEAARSR